MYKAQENYLKWIIRFQCLINWVFPRDVEIKIKELPQFTKKSPYFLNIIIWFKVNKRLFRVCVPSGKDFYNLKEIPEAFLRAYKRTIKRIEREENQNG